MVKVFVLVVSLITNVWFAIRIIDLEQFGYAAKLQIADVDSSCGVYDEKVTKIDVLMCLEEQKNRTPQFLDLIYGINIL